MDLYSEGRDSAPSSHVASTSTNKEAKEKGVFGMFSYGCFSGSSLMLISRQWHLLPYLLSISFGGLFLSGVSKLLNTLVDLVS